MNARFVRRLGTTALLNSWKGKYVKIGYIGDYSAGWIRLRYGSWGNAFFSSELLFSRSTSGLSSKAVTTIKTHTYFNVYRVDRILYLEISTATMDGTLDISAQGLSSFDLGAEVLDSLPDNSILITNFPLSAT